MMKHTGPPRQSNCSGKAQECDTMSPFPSLGYKAKAFLSVSPGDTAAPSFQRAVLKCFHTFFPASQALGKCPFEEPNMDFFFFGRVVEELINRSFSSHRRAHHSHKTSLEILLA